MRLLHSARIPDFYQKIQHNRIWLYERLPFVFCNLIAFDGSYSSPFSGKGASLSGSSLEERHSRAVLRRPAPLPGTAEL